MAVCPELRAFRTTMQSPLDSSVPEKTTCQKTGKCMTPEAEQSLITLNKVKIASKYIIVSRDL
jgi:hypothetical protein